MASTRAAKPETNRDRASTDRTDPPDPESGRGAVRCFLFDADGSDREVSLHDVEAGHLRPDQLLWVDADDTDRETLEEIARRLSLAPDAVQDLRCPPKAPMVVDYDDQFLVTVAVLVDPEETRAVPLHCLVGGSWILTTHSAGTDLIEQFLQPLKGETGLGHLDGPRFLAILLDWLLHSYFARLEDLANEIDVLDESLLRTDDVHEERLLDRLVLLRRTIGTLRRALLPHRAVFATLAQPEFDQVSESDSARRFRGLSERLERAVDEAENAREMVIGTFQVYATRTAQRTNDVVQILTVLSAVLLPAVVIAGILGMNFHPSFFDQPGLFWVAVGAILLLCTGIAFFARARGWLGRSGPTTRDRAGFRSRRPGAR
jgi:Mg2+ and Co2+ transporter CorA